MRAVNLIPAERRRGASVGLGRSQGAAYAVLLVAVAGALLVYLYGSARHQISTTQAQVATIDAQAQQAQSDAGTLSTYEKLNTTRETRLNAVQSLVNSRFDWAHTLHEFGRVLPAGVSISDLAGTVGTSAGATTTAAAPAAPATAAGAGAKVASSASSVTSATPPGSVPSFTLTGCASSQIEVARALERLRLIDGVKEVTLQTSTSSGSSGAGAGGGGCGNGPSFTAAISFAPLPAETAYAAKPISDVVGAEAPGRVK